MSLYILFLQHARSLALQRLHAVLDLVMSGAMNARVRGTKDHNSCSHRFSSDLLKALPKLARVERRCPGHFSCCLLRWPGAAATAPCMHCTCIRAADARREQHPPETASGAPCPKPLRGPPRRACSPAFDRCVSVWILPGFRQASG